MRRQQFRVEFVQPGLAAHLLRFFTAVAGEHNGSFHTLRFQLCQGVFDAGFEGVGKRHATQIEIVLRSMDSAV